MRWNTRDALDAWVNLPFDQRLLSVAGVMLLLGFALLFWTPLGNRQAARYCFALALLSHLMVWGVARRYFANEGDYADAQRPGVPVAVEIPIDFSPESAAARDPQMESLRNTVLDLRDRRVVPPPLHSQGPEPRKNALAEQAQTWNEPAAPKVKPQFEPLAESSNPLRGVSSRPTKATPAEAPLPAMVAKSRGGDRPPGLPPPPTQRPVDRRLATAEPIQKDFQAPAPRAASIPEVEEKPMFEIRTVAPRRRLAVEAAPAPTAPATPRNPPPESMIARVPPPPNRAPPSLVSQPQQSESAEMVPIPGRRVAAGDLPTPAVEGSATPPRLIASISPNFGNSASRIHVDPAPAPEPSRPAAGRGADPTARRAIGPQGDLGAHRSGANRRQLLERFGGNEKTERAVADALEWLAAHQAQDGRWSGDKFTQQCPAGDECEGKAIEIGSDVGLTGLAVLSFLGAGHTHLEPGKYQEVVRRGMNWILTEQFPDGDLQGRSRMGRIYSHAIAALALTEAYQMSGDERLIPYAQKAIDWLVRAQHPELGGWRYAPGIDSDTSVFGWGVMALASAKQAGLRVPASSWNLAKKWLPRVSSGPARALTAYQKGHEPSLAMTAEGLVCRQMFGAAHDDEVTSQAAIFLLSKPPDPLDPNLYYWYYGTLALFHLDDARWDRWNDDLQRALLGRQRRNGHAKGSWDPQRPFGIDGGRVFSTATSALCLEVYYRHLPLYKDASRERER